MFVDKGFESTPFKIFWLVIIMELLIFENRLVLGRHLHRHSNSRRLYRQSINPIVPVSDNIESNDNNIPDYEKLENVNCVYIDEDGVPKIRSMQKQPEDFVFLDDAHDAPNELGDNERFTYIEDNKLDRDTAGEKVEENNSANNPIVPPCIGSRNIIKAPLKDCAKGERRDRKGECRLIISIK